jgi:hypothetical protein
MSPRRPSRRNWSRFPSRPRRRPARSTKPLEPQVTITRRGEDKVEEFRISGKLYMMKVTPSHGVPYYLLDHSGNGQWVRQDSKDAGLRVPMWVIGTF